MRNKSFKLKFLMAGALVAAPQMWAQETDDQEARQEAVIVTASPIRDSEAAAIAAKRDASNVLDIISADTIGRFPDQNLADSLGRLPGIAIERDQGQARYLNFRGAPFRYTAIAFDGIAVPGAENGRIARFDSFPSVVTAAVEANKAITPDMPGEAVSGFINIRTYSPFDREGLGVSLEAGYGEQELGGGPVNKYNGRLSWSNDRFGFVVYGSNNSRVQNTDNREFDVELVNNDILVNELDFRSYFVEREDNAWGGSVEFRPEGPFERVFANTLFSEFTDNEERNQFVFDFAGGAEAIGSEVTPGDTGYQPVVLVNRLLQAGAYESSTWTSTLGSDAQFGEWLVEGRLNYTETANETFLPISYSLAGTAGASYDVTDIQSPIVNVFNTGTQTPRSINGLRYAATLGLIVNSNLDNEAVKAKLDAERALGLFGLDTTLKIGGMYDTREATGVAIAQGIGGYPSSINIDDYVTGVPWYTDFNNSINATYFNNEALRAAWEEAIGGFDQSAPSDQLISITEDIISVYAMATTEFEGGNIVYGARVEMTDYTSDGPDLDVSYSDDYVNFLPSVHLNLDLTEDLKFRASASTGLSRPTYNELRASAAVDPTSRTAVGGNPTLEAETTWGGDLALEWYYAPASLLSAGVFYRHIDDVIYADSTTVDGGIYFPEEAGQEWTLSGYVNGKEGYLAGLEANFVGQATFLPEPFDGLGVSGNLTLLESEFETNSGTKFSLPGTSDLIYNASIYYEKFGVSARLNYQFRDDWLSTTENDSLGEYWASQQRVDASIRYALPYTYKGTQLTVFANGNNLTDETDVRYVGTERTPNQVEGYGRYWLVGLRADF